MTFSTVSLLLDMNILNQ